MDKKDTLSKLKEKEREFRRELIIKAAREVFGKKTYDSVSMAEIARSAGMAKSSIYTYFKSQEELYVDIACKDSIVFIKGLEKQIKALDQETTEEIVHAVIHHFLDYYILHEAQWRMITHFALHGKKDKGSLGKLNEIGRQLMDLFELMFKKIGCNTDTRLMSHSLFSCLSGILIAFRNYPGREDAERVAHMKKIGDVIGKMILALVGKAG